MSQHGLAATRSFSLTDITNTHGGRREGSGRRSGSSSPSPKSASGRSGNVKKARSSKSHSVQENLSYEAQQDLVINPRGRSWGVEESCLILTLILSLLIEPHISTTEVLQRVSILIRRGYVGIHALWRHWCDEQNVMIISTANRGAGATRHINHCHHMTPEAVIMMSEFIREKNRDGSGVTVKEIRGHLIDSVLKLSISKPTLREVLHKLGYKYGRGKVIGKMNDEWRRQRIRYFLLEYSKALKEQSNGTAIIVYTDETYVNANHARDETWTCADDPLSNFLVRPSSKGKRLVILHALTRDGLIFRDSDVSNDVASQESFNSELIYEANKGDGDYHDNMNGQIFIDWVVYHLIPSFNNKYRNKKMILVLDNAAYHHWHGPHSISVNSLSKPAAASVLIDICKVTSITVKRQIKGTDEYDDHVFDDTSTWFARGGARGPSLDELKAVIKEQFSLKPHLNCSLIKTEFNTCGFQLIYTPPYLPEVQPIERAWAIVKNYVASQYKNGRTIPQLLQQTKRGLYGDGTVDGHKGVSSTAAENIIRNAHHSMGALIAEDMSLRGDIFTVKAAPSTSLPVPDTEADVDAELNGEVEEDEEEKADRADENEYKER